jgi:N-acetyl-gamma-glutamyl-phosphate reductase
MAYKVYVDGQEGTTGLRIFEYLSKRTKELDILRIDPDKRKDIEERRRLINEADIVFLCLPDEASREAVSLIDNPRTKVIDASTAFRTHPDWAYGLPELSKEHRERIKHSNRVANPGCHATAFNLLTYPLVKEGILPKDVQVSATSITGYSGGGKKMIANYETSGNTKLLVPRHYALKLTHKHLPEMRMIPGFKYTPIFSPIVSNYYKGLAVTIPLSPRNLSKKMDAKELSIFFANYYKDEKLIQVIPYGSDEFLDEGCLDITACNDTNRSDIFVFGNQEQILLTCRLDNLGKGACGAAIQNMNIMLGLDELSGI